MTPTRDAATVLALREVEGLLQVFMVRRDSRLGFLGGAHVFPGGALDEGDFAAPMLDLMVGSDRVAAPGRLHPEGPRACGLLAAAARELFEEAGILLARDPSGGWVDLDDESERARRLIAARAALGAGTGDFAEVLRGEGLTLDVGELRFFAHWITPEREKKRFDTRFFLVRAPECQSATHCAIESTAGEWLAPGEALARYRAREIELVPPTIASLDRLATFSTVDAALAAFVDCEIPQILPKLVLGGENVAILYPGDDDYESGVVRAPEGQKLNRLVLRDGLWDRP